MICAYYADPSHANSICVQNLAEEFVREGHKVHVLAKCDSGMQDVEKNGVRLHLFNHNLCSRISRWLEKKENIIFKLMFFVFRFIRYCYTLCFYPNVAPIESERIYKRAQKQINNEGIDTVVSFYRSYENVAAAIKLKNHFGGGVKVVSYHLDLLSSPNNKSSIILNIKNSRHGKAIDKELAILDKILLPNSAPNLDNPKVNYVDFPLYIPQQLAEIEGYPFDKATINISYVGSLDSMNRNPKQVLNMIDALPEINGKRVVVHIWGKLSDNATRQVVDKCKNAIYHGMAEVTEVAGIQQGSDFLLNIGNRVTNMMVPSKIFQMFASNKPIIFYVSATKDASLTYFEKYENFVKISQNDNDVSFLKDYIKDYYGSTFEKRNDLFTESTPEYICNIILK